MNIKLWTMKVQPEQAEVSSLQNPSRIISYKDETECLRTWHLKHIA